MQVEKRIHFLSFVLREWSVEKVPDPNKTYTATGWHYELTALLMQFGYRPVGRFEAYDLAKKPLKLSYDR